MNETHNNDRTPEDREVGVRHPQQRQARERVDAQAERSPERKNATWTPQQSMFGGVGGDA